MPSSTDTSAWLALSETATDLIKFKKEKVDKCDECNRISNLYSASSNQINFQIDDSNIVICDSIVCAYCHYKVMKHYAQIIDARRPSQELHYDDAYKKLMMSKASLQEQAAKDYAESKVCSICFELELPTPSYELQAYEINLGDVRNPNADSTMQTHFIHYQCASRVKTCDGTCSEILPNGDADWYYTQFYRFNIGERYRYPSIYTIDCDNFCASCFDEAKDNNDVYYCVRCEEYTYEAHSWDGEPYCESCYDQVINYCHSCDENYHVDSGHYCPDDDSDDSDDDSLIHNYGYKPAPEMFGNGKYYLGFELEVEAHNHSRHDGAEKAQNILSHHAYMKEDGSLNDGFEIVTHPHTLEAYNANFKWNFLSELQRMGFRSWNTSTCGLHVHVSRTAFDPVYGIRTPTRKEIVLRRQAHELRFTKLIYDNQRQVERIAGRSSHYSSFEDKGNLVSKVKHGYQGNGRYAAVNTENHATLEVRVFRGSLKESRVRSALEFVHAAVEYTRDLKVNSKNNALAWSKFVAYVVTNEDKYPNLLAIINQTFTNEPLVD